MEKENIKDLRKVKLEIGMYDDAGMKGVHFHNYLEDYLVKGGFMGPSIYAGLSQMEITLLRNQLRQQGKAIPATAFEKMLYAYDIMPTGPMSSKVNKFFETPNITTLFPEYISNRVYATAMNVAKFMGFIANTNIIKGLKYKKIYLQDTATDRQLGETARGGEFPRTRIALADEDISLRKYGRILEFDYESIAETSLTTLETVVLKRIGQQIGIDMTDRLIYVLINGDGNSNGLESAQTVTTDSTTLINKDDIIKLMSCLPTPYQFNKFFIRTAYWRKYVSTLSDMTNPAAQKAEIGIPFPMAERWDETVLTSDLALGVDSREAVEYITTDLAILEESQKVITKQTVETVISIRVNFSVIDQDAIGALDIEH